MGFNLATFNVVMLGVCFLFIFTAFQTGAMIQKTVLETYANETLHTNHHYTGDGYISLAIIYLVFSLTNWLAAPIVVVLGPRVSIFLGGIIYTGFIAHFIHPISWLLYVMSAILGLAAAVIWTAQGNFLTLNSTDQTMTRNSGIFWAIFQSSLLFGNLFVYFQFNGKKTIDDETRITVYGALTGAGVFGTLLVFSLRKPPNRSTASVSGESDIKGSRMQWAAQSCRKMAQEFVCSVKIMFTKQMLLLFLGFFYSGIELTFFSSVYGTVISHSFVGADKLLGISGMLIGCGEIFGGLLFGIMGKQTNKYGKDVIVLLGYVIHMITFYLIFLNAASNSPAHVDLSPVYLGTSISDSGREALALACSFLLGFADSCWNTQMIAVLGLLYPDNSGPAFSLFKFAQSMAAAIGFFYSSALALPYQLLILVVTGTFGAGGFFKVEWDTRRKANEYQPINEEG